MYAPIADNCSLLAATLSANYLNTTTSPFPVVESKQQLSPRRSSLLDEESFRDDDKDDDYSRLSQYLSTHGVLLTMCFGRFGGGGPHGGGGPGFPPPSGEGGETSHPCIIGIDEDHIAASWIHQDIGYEHIIPVQPAIGLVIDPIATETYIHCIYPTDAASDMRDNFGCGPTKLDPIYGSQGASKIDSVNLMILREKFTRYKNINFGISTPWNNISCKVLFPSSSSTSPTMWRLKEDDNIESSSSSNYCKSNNTPSVDPKLRTATMGDPRHNRYIYSTMLETTKRIYDSYMGFSVCNLTMPVQEFDDDEPPPPATPMGNIWMYNGPCSWNPTKDWSTMVTMQLEMLTMSPETKIWNEIVLRLPTQMKDIISAVFYIVSSDMTHDDLVTIQRQANQEAKLLGGKPVLQINATAMEQHDGSPLFTCPSHLTRQAS